MRTRRVAVLAVIFLCLGAVTFAQETEIPLKDWTAPPYWTPPAAGQTERQPGEMEASALALPSAPLPFVAIAPCRIVDTRVANSDGFHQPAFANGETRTFNFPASTGCPGLPVTAGAYSVNFNYRPLSQASYLTAFPTGTTMPVVATVVGYPTTWIGNAAIVPAGTSGQIDVYSQYAAHVVIDVNGYYGPQSVVTSLNTLTGDLTLAEGTNVTITPGAGTLTIAATGGPGGVLPTGTTGQTLYNNGSAWTASSALTNDGTNVGVSGNLNLPNTTASVGQITFGGDPFLHNYGPASDAGNTFVGQLAGNFTMGGPGSQGRYNTATGYLSLSANTTGALNTATGYQSLLSNTTGSGNTATGYLSLSANTTGVLNTATGYQSLLSNTTGALNTASGSYSLVSNTTGSWNTASGYRSLFANTTGYDNTASGYYALAYNKTAGNNTAVGYEALYAQSFSNADTPWDSDNTAVGSKALHANQPTSTSTGIQNTAVGSQALQANTTGSFNTANGYQSLFANTTGYSNTANGYRSLVSNTTGFANTASGHQSLLSNTTGSGNTASGNASLLYNTAGSGNTASGLFAGESNTTGALNTFLGAYSDSAADNLQNATAVGYGATVNASNKVRIGNASVTVIEGQVQFTASSDARLKQNIRDLGLGLDFVLRLRPVSFTMTQGNGRTDMGFLAQDVEALLGDGYNVLGIGGDPDRTLSLRHTDLIAPLVKAVQEQQAEIEALKTRLAERDDQQAQIEELRRQVRMLMETRQAVRP